MCKASSGNRWSQMLLEFIANPKQWQVCSRPGLVVKGMPRQIQAPWSSCSSGGWQPTWGFQGAGWPCPTEELFIFKPSIAHHCYDYGTIHIWSLIIYFLLSKNELIRLLCHNRRKQRILCRKNVKQNL